MSSGPEPVKTNKRLQVIWRDADRKATVIADSCKGYVVEEGSSAYYIPISDIDMSLIKPSSARRTVCPWKGEALYYDFTAPSAQESTVTGRIWSYPTPKPAFERIKDCLCFYGTSNTDADKVGNWQCIYA